jgi:hypothetical protein
MASMAGLARALRYAAMVPHFQWFFFLRDYGAMGISPGQSPAGGIQWKGARDDS